MMPLSNAINAESFFFFQRNIRGNERMALMGTFTLEKRESLYTRIAKSKWEIFIKRSEFFESMSKKIKK